jgi:hypothetical protein
VFSSAYTETLGSWACYNEAGYEIRAKRAPEPNCLHVPTNEPPKLLSPQRPPPQPTVVPNLPPCQTNPVPFPDTSGFFPPTPNHHPPVHLYPFSPLTRNPNTLHIDKVLDWTPYIGALLRRRFQPKGILKS